ncbi:glycoside hydrolase family 25 protein [Hydnomerulius pinastri MD-312]|uniref:Lysozyme n=1 Tax=Hydnomerulius pinastri MD-312 TaxID=994086 RepID=A0A0C9VCX8_9AGAM|nr:glycoside hydrolase family 25 protein [Hydnomerulius pinastri MD-312]
MKSFASLVLLAAVAIASPMEKRSDPLGIDVSSFQGDVDWNTWKSKGVTFAYIKATEGTSYTNPYFSAQYTGATSAKLIRGSYHFGHPDDGAGSSQATYFIKNGGGWSADGITLPGALDIEYNPSGSECYGLSASSMVSWIQSFSNEYHSSEKRYPVIYTTTDWWKSCTGNSAAFATNNPLWIAAPGSSVGTLPAGWSFTTFWQYGQSGTDLDKFNGDSTGLEKMAKGS